MSLANPSHHSVHGRRIREDEPQFWIDAFQADLSNQQLSDDHQAWVRVTGTLLTIVTIGVALAIVSVVMCW